MIKGQEFHSIIQNAFGDVKGLNISSQVQVNCPRCQENEGLSSPDGKYNLEISTERRFFRCWRCDDPKFSGSLGKLIHLYGSKIDYALFKVYNASYASFDDYEEEIEYVPVELPEEMILFSQMEAGNVAHFEAYNYMINVRKIGRELLIKYNIGFCIEGKYKKRIIIPSYDKNGIINYFVARNYDTGNKKIKPYDNPKSDKSRIIFNEGLINWDMTVYLVEGAFEMLSLPINTIPMLGKTISEALFFKIKELKPNIVILLDPDAYKNSVELFYKLQSIYIDCEERIKIIALPNNDDLDELRRYQGDERVVEALYTLRALTVNDYFITKMHESDRYDPYTKYFKRE
jgi:hypothetical protein